MATLAHRLFRATSWDQPILSPSKVQAAYLAKLEQECPLLEPAQREVLAKLEMTKLPPGLFRSPRFRVLDAVLKATSATLVIVLVADGLRESFPISLLVLLAALTDFTAFAVTVSLPSRALQGCRGQLVSGSSKFISLSSTLPQIKDTAHRVRKLEREGTAAELEASKKLVGLGAVGVPVGPLA
ncbi:hypothetical protein JCM21900_001688 [Sporobolomyces salmonicolor]